MLPLVAIGPTEWLIILAIALLLFGGSRLAGIGKGVGAPSVSSSKKSRRSRGPHRIPRPSTPRS